MTYCEWCGRVSPDGLCAVCERVGATEWGAFDECDARAVAAAWHGGQCSPLYALASAGALEWRAGVGIDPLLREIGACVREASADDVAELVALEQWARSTWANMGGRA